MADSQARTIDGTSRASRPRRRRCCVSAGVITETAPQATETISYGMPTFDLYGRHLIHFAGYAKTRVSTRCRSSTRTSSASSRRYRSGTAAARFVPGEPLPADLIRRIVRYQVARKEGARRRPERRPPGGARASGAGAVRRPLRRRA